MKINKKIPIAFLLLMIFPFLGFIYSIFSIKSNNKNTAIFLMISLFYGIFFLKIPPMYDLNIRYWEIMSTANGTFLDIVNTHRDIILYVISSFLLKLGLPFYFIPAISVTSIVFLFLLSYQNFYFKSEISNISDKKFIFSVFGILLFFNFLNYGMGIRFGLSLAMLIYAVSLMVINSKNKSLIFMILSILTHFSMVVPIFALILSMLISVNKKNAIIMSILALFVSEGLVKNIVGGIDIMGLGEHTQHYIDGQWSEAAKNINSQIISYIQRCIFIIFLIFYMFSNVKIKKMDNFINIMLIISSFFFFSFTAHGRYIVVVTSLLVMRSTLSLLGYKYESSVFKFILKFTLIIIIIYSFFVANIYANRRVIIFGEMWKTLYTPPMFIIYNHGQKEFESYFMSIDENGYWKDSDQRQTD